MEAESKTLQVNVESIAGAPSLPLQAREALIILATLALGGIVWNIAPMPPLGENGMHFLATMIVAVSLWVLDVFDEYIVGLMLLLAWVTLDIVPAKVALAGFGQNSWFFTVGALGIAAAIGKTSLLQRLSRKVLRWIPVSYQRTYALFLLAAGVLSGPLLPTGKARAAVAVPVGQAIVQAFGFRPRSNGSAAISLAAFIGFSQMSFMFLTAGEHCLIAWNFLPPALKAQFAWLDWFLAALPAALTIILFMSFAVQYLLPVSLQERASLAKTAIRAALAAPATINRREWLALATLILTVVGWLTTSLHGVNEAWVALAALLVFLLS